MGGGPRRAALVGAALGGAGKRASLRPPRGAEPVRERHGRLREMPGPPTITSVSPTMGPLGGGTAITITGTNLTGATGVKVGSVNATGVVVVNATTMIGAHPGVDHGGRKAGVGDDAARIGDACERVHVRRGADDHGGRAGTGPDIRRHDAHDHGHELHRRDGRDRWRNRVDKRDRAERDPDHGGDAGPAAAGAKNVVVTAAGGSVTKTNAFTYVAPPSITSFTPTSGPLAGGTTITITGTTLSGTTNVRFDGNAATAFTVVNATP